MNHPTIGDVVGRYQTVEGHQVFTVSGEAQLDATIIKDGIGLLAEISIEGAEYVGLTVVLSEFKDWLEGCLKLVSEAEMALGDPNGI